ncbi:hypothetical protein EII17_06565 [Clostridiales bacterium COT073_COT-073]|nr:hypothetical protein EII17_06565 [Clostridiales bacterium COT073_COT-073]
MNSHDKNEKIIQSALSQITVDSSQIKDNVKNQLKVNALSDFSETSPYYSRKKIIAAALILFLILGSTVTAAKLGSFGWLMETINPRYREVVEPVEAFSEDNDIRLEIIGAQKYENTAVVYLSLQDISGQKRLTEKSDFSDTLNVATTFPKKTSSLKEEVSSSISVGKKLLFFDAENNKLYYEFYISADGYSPLTDNLQISAKVINFDYQPYEGEIPLQSLKLEENAPIRIDGKHIISAAWSNEDPGNELWALPLGNPERLTDERGDLKLSNIGIIDGQLHLQTLSPFQGEFGSKFHSFDLIDPQGNKIEEEYSFSFVSDNQGTLIHLSKDNFDNAINRYNEYVFPIEPNEASSYTIRYSFDVITGTEGEWKVAANLTDSSKQMKRLTNSDNIDGHIFNTIIISPLGLEVHGTYEGNECQASEMKLTLETVSGQIPLPSGYGSSYDHRFYYHWKFDKIIKVEEIKALLVNDHSISVR